MAGEARRTSPWDLRFLALASEVAGWSKDPSTRVGAVIADARNRVVGFGFNGFPRGVKDDDRLHDRSTKYEIIIHAEVNAVLNAARSVEGCTVYTWPLPPCSRCAAFLIQSGVSRVVSPPAGERWRESCGLGRKLFDDVGIACVEIDPVLITKGAD